MPGNSVPVVRPRPSSPQRDDLPGLDGSDGTFDRSSAREDGTLVAGIAMTGNEASQRSPPRMSTVGSAWTRARAKTWRQFVRSTALRIWPLSIIARMFYRMCWSERGRNFLNRRAKAAYGATPPTIDNEQRRCVRELQVSGVAVTSLPELISDEELGETLRREVAQLFQAPALRRQIDGRRAQLGEKWYVVRALGYASSYDVPEPVAQIALHPRILAVVNSYLGLYSRLDYVNVWYNFPVSTGEPGIDSERWHRDHEDRNIVKMYLYIDDVDESMGPLTYLRGTQPGGPYGSVLAALPAQGRYPDVRELTHLVPADARITCTGSAGTIVFCDSAGLHRGGRSTTRPRVVLTATYVTDSGVDRRTFRLAADTLVPIRDAAVTFALRRERVWWRH